MSRGLARHAGSLAALATAVLVALPAAPAAAAEGGPRITFDGPRASPPLVSGTVVISGQAEVDSLSLYRMREVTVAVGDDRETFPCSDSPCRFSRTVRLDHNGTYRATVTARQTTILVGGPGPSGEASRSFSVAAPPKAPTLDPPTVTEGRAVELSWARNTEPDMKYYAVFRKAGGSDLRKIGEVEQRSSGSKMRFTDSETSLLEGAEYVYQVVAVRAGVTDKVEDEVASEPSRAGTAAVPPRPTTTTAAPNADPGAPPASGPTTTVKPGAANGVDLSGFLSSRAQPVPLSPITVPEPPDTGFGNTLPFGSLPSGEELEEGELEAVPPGDVQRRSVFSRIDSGRPLVPVAGGLILLLLALHLRVLNRRIKDVPDGDLPVDGASSAVAAAAGDDPAGAAMAAPSGAAPPVARREPEPEVQPQPALYDVLAEEDWDDEEWAPVVAQAQPELEPELEPEPEPEFEPVARLEPEPVALVEPEPVWEREPEILEPELEPEPEPVSLWEPPVLDEPNEDEIEVFEVVSPTSRRLARAGSR